MNSSRMKYASTPTYGMQKRGYAKKQSAVTPPASPDFTQTPSTPETPVMPYSSQQAPFAMPGAPMGGQSGMFQNMPFSQNPFPPMQNVTQPSPYPQASYGQPFGYASAYPPAPMSSQQQPMQPAAPLSAAPDFRQQGFVPSSGRLAGSASVSPIGYPPVNGFSQGMGGMNTPSPFYAAPLQQPAMPQSGMPMQTQPGMPTQPFLGGAPMGGMPQQPSQPQPSRKPMEKDAILKIFLFAVLPVLFIPCLFVPQSFNFLRYAFVALCVGGLGLMWAWRTFSQSTRSTLSIIYVALCVVVVSMLFSGAKDARTASSQAAGDLQVTATPAPGSAIVVDNSQAEAQPTVAPETEPPLGTSEAEVRLTLFMDYWQVMNIENMVTLVQPSWASTANVPSTSLFTLLSNRTPTEYTIESISGSDSDSSRTVTMSALIDKNNGKDPVRYRFQIIMVKESGSWYVDPNSLATNDVVATQDPNATPTVGNMTAAPRTTVTPVPDPSTKLYYNPNGGSKYHLDPNCSTVAEKYLPLTAFPYSELGNAPYNKLTPCLKCGAPTQAAE